MPVGRAPVRCRQPSLLAAPLLRSTAWPPAPLPTLPAADNPEDVEDAEYVLQQYKRCFEGDLGTEGGALGVADTLRTLRGAWAFVVHDRSRGRVVAARDACGEEPLCWGTTLLSEGVLFASDRRAQLLPP